MSILKTVEASYLLPPDPRAQALVESAMAAVEWESCPPGKYADLPYPVDRGVLELFGRKLRVYRLDDGRIVIHAGDLMDFMDRKLQ